MTSYNVGQRGSVQWSAQQELEEIRKRRKKVLQGVRKRRAQIVERFRHKMTNGRDP